MVAVERFVDGLKSAGVEFFAGVPADSLLKGFCMHVTDTCVVKKAAPTHNFNYH
jgi:hypothetical protein